MPAPSASAHSSRWLLLPCGLLQNLQCGTVRTSLEAHNFKLHSNLCLCNASFLTLQIANTVHCTVDSGVTHLVSCKIERFLTCTVAQFHVTGCTCQSPFNTPAFLFHTLNTDLIRTNRSAVQVLLLLLLCHAQGTPITRFKDRGS